MHLQLQVLGFQPLLLHPRMCCVSFQLPRANLQLGGSFIGFSGAFISSRCSFSRLLGGGVCRSCLSLIG
ncbi:hypothetical protein EBB05_16130 [Methylobacterium brachiatum]|nr:hypothetical protein EBB05_16130 [Methylobacterium brachiatum]